MSQVLQQRLLALPAIARRSGMRRMADVLPEIERALASGVSRSAVVEALKDGGIEMTMATFAGNLYRLRKASAGKRTAEPAPIRTEPLAPAATGHLTGESPHKYGQHDPRRLDDVLRNAPDMKALARLAKKE